MKNDNNDKKIGGIRRSVKEKEYIENEIEKAVKNGYLNFYLLHQHMLRWIKNNNKIKNKSFKVSTLREYIRKVKLTRSNISDEDLPNPNSSINDKDPSNPNLNINDTYSKSNSTTIIDNKFEELSKEIINELPLGTINKITNKETPKGEVEKAKKIIKKYLIENENYIKSDFNDEVYKVKNKNDKSDKKETQKELKNIIKSHLYDIKILKERVNTLDIKTLKINENNNKIIDDDKFDIYIELRSKECYEQALVNILYELFDAETYAIVPFTGGVLMQVIGSDNLKTIMNIINKFH